MGSERPLVGLVFGGRSVEHRVSVVSARTVAAALRAGGHRVVPLAVARDGCWTPPEVGARALAGEIDAVPAAGGSAAASLEHLLAAAPEVVFPLVHGTWGEDGSLQGLCEMLDLPYVGAGVAPSAVAMDKVLCKRLLEAAGIPVVAYLAVTAARFEEDPDGVREELAPLGRPLFVKPANGGSSVGVSRVDEGGDVDAALALAFGFDDGVLVERGISGRELECSVLGDRRIEASAVGEIVPGNEFYDYADKYLQDTARLVIPAPLVEGVEERVRELAVRSFAAVGGWGMARVDFLLEGEETLYVNEINTLPGFTSISMYPKLWEVSGLPLEELVARLVEIARARHRRRRRLDGAIEAWLRALER